MAAERMAEHGNGATFIHIASPNNAANRPAFISNYAQITRALALQIAADKIQGQTAPFHGQFKLMHNHAMNVSTCNASTCAENISPEILADCLSTAKQLRADYPIIKTLPPNAREAGNPFVSEESVKETIEQERQISSGIMAKNA